MRITAALVAERGAPFRLEPLELAEPASDEVVVRVAAAGLCQTDVHARDDYFGIPFPAVFGHEGAGVVEQVGAAVRKVAPGDRVTRGTTLVVLEAMKMELPIKAPADGTVVSLACRVGELVQPGVTLVELR